MHGAMFSAQTVEWSTPKALYQALDAEFHFDFDPCPIDGGADGTARLLNPWTGKRVFCNPPYGPDIRKFLDCWRDAELSVFLLPARGHTSRDAPLLPARMRGGVRERESVVRPQQGK